MSSYQLQMWAAHMFSNNSSEYNTPSAFHLKGGKISVPILEQCLLVIQKRHAILRTRYVTYDEVGVGNTGELNEPAMQVVDEDCDIKVVVKTEQNFEAALETATSYAKKSFVLAEEIPVRVCLVSISNTPNESILVVVFHHIAFDGMSEAVFIRELTQVYNQISEMGVYPKEEISNQRLQYLDYAHYQREQLRNTEWRADHADYWKSIFSDDEVINSYMELPFDRKRTPGDLQLFK